MSDPSTDPDVPALQTRLTREYGLRHPFVGAGMGFIAHEQLAAAVTNAGGLGVLGASPDPAASLIVMVERLRALTCGRSEWTSSAPILHSGRPALTSTSTHASSWTSRWSFSTMTHRRPAGSARYVPRVSVCGCKPPRPKSPPLQSDSVSAG